MRINLQQEIAHRRASICMLEDRLSFGARVYDDGLDTGRRKPMAPEDEARALKTMRILSEQVDDLERRQATMPNRISRVVLSEQKNAIVCEAIEDGARYSTEIQAKTGFDKKQVDSCTNSLFRRGKITREKVKIDGREMNRWTPALM